MTSPCSSLPALLTRSRRLQKLELPLTLCSNCLSHRAPLYLPCLRRSGRSKRDRRQIHTTQDLGQDKKGRNQSNGKRCRVVWSSVTRPRLQSQHSLLLAGLPEQEQQLLLRRHYHILHHHHRYLWCNQSMQQLQFLPLHKTASFSVLNRPPPKYEGHIPLTRTEKGALAVGSALTALLDPRRHGTYRIQTHLRSPNHHQQRSITHVTYKETPSQTSTL